MEKNRRSLFKDALILDLALKTARIRICEIMNLLDFKIKQTEVFAAVSCEGNESDLFDLPIYKMPHEALAVIIDTNGEPFTVRSLAFYPIFLDQSPRKLEFGLNQRIIARHIVVCSIHVVVEHKAYFGNMGVAVKFVFDTISGIACPKIGVAAILAVSDHLGTALRPERQRRDFPVMPGNIAIISHQRLLKLADIHVFNGTAAFERARCRRT